MLILILMITLNKVCLIYRICNFKRVGNKWHLIFVLEQYILRQNNKKCVNVFNHIKDTHKCHRKYLLR